MKIVYIFLFLTYFNDFYCIHLLALFVIFLELNLNDNTTLSIYGKISEFNGALVIQLIIIAVCNIVDFFLIT